MASGSGLATALAVLKGHAVAAAVVGTLVVGGGAAAVVAGAAASGAAATMTIVGEVRKAVQDGTPLAHLARDCGASRATGNPGSGGGQPTGTPGARPTGTPGARPTVILGCSYHLQDLFASPP